jgi:cobalt-precorrin-5B (C1)-methyltransferase
MKSRSLRKGLTTGTCAAAATKAAALLLTYKNLKNQKIKRGDFVSVEITLPIGIRKTVNARVLDIGHSYAICSVIKDAGDDPDITDGAEIIVRLKISASESPEQIAIKGGRGVGVVTRPGLQVPVGKPAINPIPRRMIKEAIRDVLGQTPVEVTIEVPEGEALAKKTFNPRLGIIGGISIIGTRGLVEPMSQEAIKATVKCEIDVAVAETSEIVYLAPGKIGEESLKRIFGNIRVVQMSNFIGEALRYVKDKNIKRIVIGGHPGKLAKILMGYYNTHSQNSPQAAGFVARYLGLQRNFNTVEEIIEFIYAENNELKERLERLASEIARKIADDFDLKDVKVYLFDMKKNLIGGNIWDG